MIKAIECCIVLMDMQKGASSPSDASHKRLKTFTFRSTTENKERAEEIVKKLVKKFDTHFVSQKRLYSNIWTRDVYSLWEWKGQKVQESWRYVNIVESMAEEIMLSKRRLRGLKGAITRNINKAKKIRSNYRQTLFPEAYIQDEKFKRLVKNIKRNIKNYKSHHKELDKVAGLE